MNATRAERFIFFLSFTIILSSFIDAGHIQRPRSPYKPDIPRTWDEKAIGSLEVPLADSSYSPKHILARDYYSIPVRPIFTSYPKYHPDKEPRAYREKLRTREPVILWDDGAHRPKLETEDDWVKAGELVFNAPVLFTLQTSSAGESRDFIAKTGDLYDKNGVSPFATYVIRERGKLEVGEVSCAECHSRVMSDGTVIAGAQGNRPIEQVAFLGFADDAAKAKDREKFLSNARRAERANFAAPWLQSDPAARLEQFSAADIEALHFAVPAGVFSRQGTSPFSPAKLPDLIGIKERRYLDASGLVQHRGIGDLMRYAALNQGMDMLARFGDFIPAGTDDVRQSPSVFAQFAQARYSDEQLYALALYIYSLKPPLNPNRPSLMSERGEKVFQREGLCRLPYTATLHEQQTDSCGRLQSS